MNFSLFFDPVSEDLASDAGRGSIRDALHIHEGSIPDWKSSDIAVLGVPEYRGMANTEVDTDSCNRIRERFFQLKKGIGGYKVVDLGDLKPGPEKQDTDERLREVCEALLEANVIPLIIGGGHDLTFGQFRSYENQERLVSLVNVDATFDLDGKTEDGSFLQNVVEHEPSFLYTYYHIGYQSYLVNSELLKAFEKLSFEGIRLGEIRTQLEEIEPVVRSADMVTFDMLAIKRSDNPGVNGAQPFGLTAEEACQIAWYAGLSENISSFGLYGYVSDLDQNEQSAAVAATMLWYFVEGFYSRVDDLDFESEAYTKFVVAYSQQPHRIIFYKSKKSGKWWLEIGEGEVVPCSYSDYEIANQGEIPDRWVKANNKLI